MSTTVARGQVHEISQKGFGEGTNELYDRSRPTYPQAAIQDLWDNLPERAKEGPLNVLELASGTGLFTRSLLSNPLFSTHTTSLVAVEPSSGMRSVFTQNMASDPRVKCYEGTFDGMPPELEEGWADVVCIAQAWHWCIDHDAALTEILRVMKPDGILSFIWNIEDRTAAPWLDQLNEIYAPISTHLRSSYGPRPETQLDRARQTAQCATYLANFFPVGHFECTHSVPVTAEGAVDRVFSKSFMTLLKGQEREQMKEKLDECVAKGEGKVWVDEKEGTFEWPYKTHLFICKRK